MPQYQLGLAYIVTVMKTRKGSTAKKHIYLLLKQNGWKTMAIRCFDKIIQLLFLCKAVCLTCEGRGHSVVMEDTLVKRWERTWCLFFTVGDMSHRRRINRRLTGLWGRFNWARRKGGEKGLTRCLLAWVLVDTYLLWHSDTRQAVRNTDSTLQAQTGHANKHKCLQEFFQLSMYAHWNYFVSNQASSMDRKDESKHVNNNSYQLTFLVTWGRHVL